MSSGDCVERLLAVGSLHNLEARVLHVEPQHAADVLLVIGYEDPVCHAMPFPVPKVRRPEPPHRLREFIQIRYYATGFSGAKPPSSANAATGIWSAVPNETCWAAGVP